MANRRLPTIAAALLLLCLPGMAQAVQIAAGTAENVSIRQCRPGTDPVTGVSSYCYFLDAPILSVFGGSPAATSSAAGGAAAGIGSGSGSVSLSGVAGAPVLGAEASTVHAPVAPGSSQWRANASSVALQRYVYTGPTTTRTIGAALTYSQTGTAPFPNGVGGGIYAALDVFTLPVSTIDAGTTPDSNFFALFLVGGQTGYQSLASDEFFATAPTASGSASLAATVTLHSGDAVWIWALLQTPAVNGGIIDASHTFASQWDDSTGLVPAAVATVPEPGACLLMAIGLLGVAGAVGRAKTARAA